MKKYQLKSSEFEIVAPGVYKITFGETEFATPSNQFYRKNPCINALQAMPRVEKLPFDLEKVIFSITKRGCTVELPLHCGEDLYGLGLQLKSLRQTAKKRSLRVNSDPIGDTGDSHAPAPLYFSTDGYGVMFDTLRYVNIYTGENRKASAIKLESETAQEIKLNESDLYKSQDELNNVIAEIPAVCGIDCYIFCGPTLLDAVCRYNLYAGGGCMVPAWGLGVWYRTCGAFNETQVLQTSGELRREHVPCDVIGLEPGWQEKAYSCSLSWSSERFKNHRETVRALQEQNFKINLWQHIFINPVSPLFEKLRPFAGDYAVWNGLVPDITVAEGRKHFVDYHRDNFINDNIISFKLDECDNSDYNYAPWSFPECAEFPSGKDGEQMHSALGMSYMGAIHEAVAPAGSYHSVRNAHLFASPYPFVLYSDLYDHQDFIRGLTTAGFAGMLWCPELRDAASELDYLRRLQSMILSPQMLLNVWFMPNPPWKQLDRQKNVAGELYPEAKQRELLALTLKQLRQRMQFIPYLLGAYAAYHDSGKPPFRALIMDYPQDRRLLDVDYAYLCGESLLIVPLRADETAKVVPLPPGKWHDFYTGEVFENELTAAPAPEQLAIYVKSGSTLPLNCSELEYIDENTVFDLELKVFGDNPRPALLAIMSEGELITGELETGGKLDERLQKYYRIIG